MNISWVFFASMLLCLSACSSTVSELDCTGELRPGIMVTTFDNLPSEAIDRFLVVARDGRFVDSAHSIIPGPLSSLSPYVLLVYERVGVYTVTV